MTHDYGEFSFESKDEVLAKAREYWNPGKTDFWVNSVAQLPNLPKVMSYAFQNRLWVIGLVVGLEAGVLILWRLMKKLERELWDK